LGRSAPPLGTHASGRPRRDGRSSKQGGQPHLSKEDPMKRVFWDAIAILAPANRKARKRQATVERVFQDLSK